MAKATLTTDPMALREAIRVLDNMPVTVTVVALKFDGDSFTFVRDSNDAWYLAEVE